MLGNFHVRTDLALEARESFEEDDVKIRGVRVETREDEEKEIRTTLVKIETENGARTMGKPVGTYITMEAPNMSGQDEDYHREISEELAYHLKKMIGEREQSVLVVGLGNRDVTPDALGPRVVSNIEITRHMIREYGRAALEGKRANEVSSLVPGVMAQTGMETLEIIKGVVEETRPDVVLVIDALAARNTRRLSRTIQISDTGINPGSWRAGDLDRRADGGGCGYDRGRYDGGDGGNAGFFREGPGFWRSPGNPEPGGKAADDPGTAVAASEYDVCDAKRH